jgi:hypothetical protein
MTHMTKTIDHHGVDVAVIDDGRIVSLAGSFGFDHPAAP